MSICFILSLIISGISCEFNERTESKNEIPGNEKKEITNEYIVVAKVVDGDTFKMSDGSEFGCLSDKHNAGLRDNSFEILD